MSGETDTDRHIPLQDFTEPPDDDEEDIEVQSTVLPPPQGAWLPKIYASHVLSTWVCFLLVLLCHSLHLIILNRAIAHGNLSSLLRWPKYFRGPFDP